LFAFWLKNGFTIFSIYLIIASMFTNFLAEIQEPTTRKKMVKKIIFWSVVILGIVALFIPFSSAGPLENTYLVEPRKVVDLAYFSSLLTYNTLSIDIIEPCDLGPCVKDIDKTKTFDGIVTFIFSMVNTMLYIAFGIGVLMLIYAGWKRTAPGFSLQILKDPIVSIAVALLGMGLIYFIFRLVFDVASIIGNLFR